MARYALCLPLCIFLTPIPKQITPSPYANAPAKPGIPEFEHSGFHGNRIDDATAMGLRFGSIDGPMLAVGQAHKRNIKLLPEEVYKHRYGSGYASHRTLDA